MVVSFFNFVETWVYPVFMVILISIGIGSALVPELKDALQTLTLN